MLVLTRKQQETIQIGDSIIVKVLRTKGNTVRLGIEAPEGLRVLRGELTPEPNHREPPAAPLARRQRASAPAARAEGEVRMARVPRSRVATVLPQMLGSSAPLRAMLDRRATVSADA
ncbi:hypothetical protein Pla175_17390 [Pirellulimonas nuda]|uniref:Translational regulator CsrA n=1 Tax=Pirellulimonas nuda TaxID=2528009 RepID=A0A518DA51_9BACT|nr:carbon storage regulator [Pirellulimonas nuda]QDU88364.1 hypothetical protein Pla175_17390 [Pirellulimonas nuda]